MTIATLGKPPRMVGLARTIKRMFTTGVNGAWYDPSDFSTMFQDAAGTTPVTAVGRPVGLMLDKSKGLVLGSQLRSSGTTALIGSATPATYNTSTGEGTAARVNPTNQSGVNFSGLSASSTYIVNISNTGTATLSIRNGGVGGTTFQTLLGGASVSVYMTSATVIGITPSSDGTAISFTVVSVRELPGNHAFNPSGNSANFPVLSARYNLLTNTGFTGAVAGTPGTSPTGWSRLLSGGTVALPGDGLFQVSVSNARDLFYQTITPSVNSTNLWSITADVIAGSRIDSLITIVNLPTGGAIASHVLDGVDVLPTAVVGAGLHRIGVRYTIGATTQAVVHYFGGGVAAAATSNVIFSKPDLRVANDALNQPAYQRVNTATDYDTVGFKPYLSFNGVNQWLQTNSIDFSYGDKMFVSAGVRKLSDAALGLLVELSATVNVNNGSFAVFAPVSAGPTYRWTNRGTNSIAISPTGYAAPISNVLTGIGDLASPLTLIRFNGSQAGSDSGSLGAGNYGNYPLYIGARAGTGLFFNGRLYGLVVAGKAASASEIASTEAWINQKTGAY